MAEVMAGREAARWTDRLPRIGGYLAQERQAAYELGFAFQSCLTTGSISGRRKGVERVASLFLDADSVQYESELMTSPPVAVPRARQVLQSMVLFTNLTEPSAYRALTPPE